MTANNKINLSLLVIVLALLALNFWPETSQYHPLSNIQTDSITTITLSKQQETMRFHLLNDSWLLTGMPEQKIDQQKILKLLGIINTHSYRQFDNTQENRKSFGLTQSAYQLTLNDTQIVFGDIDPVQQLRYVLTDNQIHLITDLYLQFFLVKDAFFHPN